MSKIHHEIADCPKCGKRDFVEKDDKQWICLSCGFSKNISKPELETGPGIGGMWLWVLLITLIWMMLTQHVSDKQEKQQKKELIENYFFAPPASLNK